MGGQHRQVALRGSFCHMAAGIERRAVTLAVEGTIRFGGKSALAMRANGGKGEQLFALANHKESLVAKITVNAVGGVVAGRTGIHDSSPVRGRSAASLAVSQPPARPAVRIRNCLRLIFMLVDSPSILKHQARENAPVNVRPRIAVKREDKSEPQPRLDPSDGVQVHPKRGISEQAVLSGIVMIHLRFPLQFKHRDELLDPGQRQSAMVNAVAEDETVFKRLQTAVRAAAQERGIAKEGLDGEILAQLSDR